MANSNAIDCKHNGTGTNTATIKRLNESVSLWGKLIIPRCWRSLSPAAWQGPCRQPCTKNPAL